MTENKNIEQISEIINSNTEKRVEPEPDMQATQRFEPITEKVEDKKTGLFGLFKKKDNTIEEEVEKKKVVDTLC